MHNLAISNSVTNENEVPSDRKKRLEVSTFSYESIMVATNNFSMERQLGKEGFGLVYMVNTKKFKRDMFKLTYDQLMLNLI